MAVSIPQVNKERPGGKSGPPSVFVNKAFTEPTLALYLLFLGPTVTTWPFTEAVCGSLVHPVD